MSDYTSSSGFEKPVPGTQAGTWGGTVNTNMDLVDEAINGMVTITLTGAGSSGSPNTMQIIDGATSPARHAFIEVTDNAFGTNQDVYLQLTETGGTVESERICWIRNNMSSGNDLYLFQGNYDVGRDYVVPQGKTALVRFTGGGSVTNCYVYNVLEDTYFQGTIQASGNITGLNLSGTNTGDNPGVTSVDTSGALSGGEITSTGTITHLDTNGYKHLPQNGSLGQFVKNTAPGSGSWATITPTDISGYETPAITTTGSNATLNGPTAATVRAAIGAGTSSTVGTVTLVSGGSGLTGSVTSSGSLAVGAGSGIQVNADSVQLDYTGSNNFIEVATNLEGSAISVNDTIVYNDATDGNVKKGLISDLPGIGSAGTVTEVIAGNGMSFTTITGTGSVVMGTPGSITDTSTNSVSASSHTHAVSHTGSGSFVMQSSPTLTGTPLAPTQAVGNNSTRIATTAFVNAEIANDAPSKTGTGASGTWGISITGNAATAGSATSATNATNAVNVTGASQPSITSVGTLTGLTTSGNIVGDGTIKLKERTSALADTAAYGQIWVKTVTPNQLWYTNDAGTDIRLDTGGTGTVTSVTGGTGLTGTVTTSGNISVDYVGSDSIIFAAADAVISTSDYIMFYDVTDSTIKKDTVSALPFTNNIGDITSVTVNAGSGLTGGGTDSSGSAIIPDIVLGTPSTCSNATTNSVTASSHTHAITGFALSSHTHSQYYESGDSPSFATVTVSTVNATTVNATTFSASALRLKNIIGDLSEARADALLELNPVEYTFKDDEEEKRQIGLIADDVAAWFPELVSYTEDGEVAGLNYAALVAPIIVKMKQMEARLQELEA